MKEQKFPENATKSEPRTNCAQCGAEILAVTAKHNKGLCGVCNRGGAASLPASTKKPFSIGKFLANTAIFILHYANPIGVKYYTAGFGTTPGEAIGGSLLQLLAWILLVAAWGGTVVACIAFGAIAAPIALVVGIPAWFRYLIDRKMGVEPEFLD